MENKKLIFKQILNKIKILFKKKRKTSSRERALVLFPLFPWPGLISTSPGPLFVSMDYTIKKRIYLI